MSSVFGIVHNNTMSQDIISRKMESMSKLTKHRGSMQKEIMLLENGKGAIGINGSDVAESKIQKSMYCSNVYHSMVDGNIVNFQEFIDDIGEVKSGASVILPLYSKYGKDFIKKLSGAFAVVLYDERNNDLHLWRDQLGAKPLYYTMQENMFIFASEIKAIYSILEKKPEVGFSAIDDILRYRFVDNDNDTVFAGIKKVMPGEHIVYNGQRIVREKYWQLPVNPYESERKNSQELHAEVEEFRELFEKVISQYLISDTEGGFFTSGGLDSSLVTAVSHGISNKSFSDSISIKFSPSTVNDEKYGAILEEFWGKKFKWAELSDETARKTLFRIVPFLDEPLENPIHIGTYVLAEHAKKLGLKTILLGDGADELFMGYDRQVCWKTFTDAKERYPLLSWIVSNEDADLLYNNNAKDILHGKQYVPEQISNIEESIFYECSKRMPGNLNMRLDSMMMAHGLEARTPFLDNRIVEFTFKLSVDDLMSGTEKGFLREVAGKYLPREVTHRPKERFPSLPDQWLRGAGSDFIKEILLDKSTFVSEYIDTNNLEMLINKHTSKERNIGRTLWALATLELWSNNLKNWSV